MTRTLSLFSALCATLLGLGVAALGQESEAPRKPQAAVASKTKTFASVAAADGSVSKALKASDLEGARKLLGKPGAFEGTVVKVYAPASNSLVILNFDENYKKALTAVIRSRHFAEFPDLSALKGKRVLVTGTFEEYQGRAEMLLKSADQIKLIK